MGVMSNRDHLVDGLHSILEELWEGSDHVAASEFRKLMVWRARAVKPSVPTYMAGTFPAMGYHQPSTTSGTRPVHVPAAVNQTCTG